MLVMYIIFACLSYIFIANNIATNIEYIILFNASVVMVHRVTCL